MAPRPFALASREKFPSRTTAPVRRALLLVGGTYLLTLLKLPREGLWIVDNGNKYQQVEALTRSGFRSAALPWPGQALYPEFYFNPLQLPFSVVQNG